MARAIVELPGAPVSVHWVPGHAGLEGNELADACAGEAAQRGVCLGPRAVSVAFLKAQRSHRATAEWRGDIVRRCRGGAPFAIPAPGIRPGVTAGVRLAPKQIAARFSRYITDTRCWPLSSGAGLDVSNAVLAGGAAEADRPESMFLRNASLGRRRLEGFGEGSVRPVLRKLGRRIYRAEGTGGERVSV